MESDVAQIAQYLKADSEVMAAASAMTARDDTSPTTDLLLRQFLKAGSELLASSSALASGPHECAVNILSRSIIEMCIKAHWATVSTGNADHVVALSKEQFKTIFKVNARSGIARVFDVDGGNRTEEFLASGVADRAQKQVSLETMAGQCGLSDIYNVFYRFQSMYSHGNDSSSGAASTQATTLCFIGAFSKLLGHMGVRWLVSRSRPDNEEIRGLLGLDAKPVR